MVEIDKTQRSFFQLEIIPRQQLRKKTNLLTTNGMPDKVNRTLFAQVWKNRLITPAKSLVFELSRMGSPIVNPSALELPEQLTGPIVHRRNRANRSSNYFKSMPGQVFLDIVKPTPVEISAHFFATPAKKTMNKNYRAVFS
jgi:hypothetical protein